MQFSNNKETLWSSMSFNAFRRYAHSSGSNNWNPAYSSGLVSLTQPQKMKSKWSFVSVSIANSTNRVCLLLVIFFPMSMLASSFSPSCFYSLPFHLFHLIWSHCDNFIPIFLNRVIIVNCECNFEIISSVCCDYNFNRQENCKIARFC